MTAHEPPGPPGDPEPIRLTEADARTLIQRGQNAILKATEAMAELREVLYPLWASEAWTVLGYDSWEQMCRAEFGISLPGWSGSNWPASWLRWA